MTHDDIRSAMNGDSESWKAICAAMFDSWPRIQKAEGEIQAEVVNASPEKP